MNNKREVKNLKELRKMATKLRCDVIKMLTEAGSGHSAGPLGLADIFSAMYFHILNYDPQRPLWDKRDRFYISCGHIVPVQYAALIEAGVLSRKYLKTLRKLGSPLQGHPSYHDLPVLESSSGPLAQGSSIAVGAALSARGDGKKHWVYCLVSDGEQEEGQTWEAAMMAGKHKLNNLIFLMDRNNIQIDGHTEDIMPLESLRDKYEAFNWHVLDIDGHNIEEIIDAVNEAKSIYEKPKMIICHTTPGKGVDFMENKPVWHGKVPSSQEAEDALVQILARKPKVLVEAD